MTTNQELQNQALKIIEESVRHALALGVPPIDIKILTGNTIAEFNMGW